MGREIIVALLVTRPFGVLANDLAPKLVRDSKAFDRSQPRDPRRPERVLRSARGSPITRDVTLNLPRNHSAYSSSCAARVADGPRMGKKMSLELVELKFQDGFGTLAPVHPRQGQARGGDHRPQDVEPVHGAAEAEPSKRETGSYRLSFSQAGGTCILVCF